MTRRGQRRAGSWSKYLERFHSERPGITEDVLGTVRDDVRGLGPYQWLLEGHPESGRILDLACGSAPLFTSKAQSGWLGVDRSMDELRRATTKSPGRVVAADSGRMPFADGSFDAVVCSMAMMLLQPLSATLSEMRRVMAPGASGHLLLPDRRPLQPRDLGRYARLLVALRQFRLHYPNDHEMAHLSAELGRSGFDVTSDERRRFSYRFDTPESVALLVRSLYLPGVSSERVAAAVDGCEHWVGSSIGIPLRRVVLRRT